MSAPNHIILYDGYCELCSRSVRFVIKRDQQKQFTYIPLQSDDGKALLKLHNIEHISDNTFVYIYDNKAYVKSTAALKVCKELKGMKWLSTFFIVPKFIRDFVYSIVAKYRYKWFGKREECFLS
ncbi:MAG: thiol-disulfide oxidoreductase DCC family protein [Bacteroidia bacterium]